jgi:threonine synthase
LPVRHFIAACNANDVVTDYLVTGNYKTKKSVSTLSNAMDVGSPSNFIRILELFHHQFGDLKNVLSSYSISDEETKATIKEVFSNYKYLADPHGAVGYLSLKKYLETHEGDKGIFLETAHPVKFYDVVEPVIQQKINLPDSIESLLKSKKKATVMEAKYDDLKEFLLK